MNLLNRILELAIQIQQIPSPTFHEGQRAKFIRDSFRDENLDDVEIDTIGNVYGRLPGIGTARPIIITAHTDTVFPFDTNLVVTRGTDTIHGPGIGDNSLGVSGLFGLLWVLRQRGTKLPGDVWLIANVCEEGLGDLNGMRSIVDRFGDHPLAYIVLEGMALGQIYHRGLGVQRYLITVKTEGGHSWVDYGTPSAIHELADLATKLTAIKLPKEPRTSLNIGIISGGTSVNTIAAQASLELDLRSTGSNTLNNLILEIETLVAKSNKQNIDFQSEVIGQRPVGEIPENHPLVKLTADVLRERGIQPSLNIGSTDANIPLSLGLPCVSIGLTTGSGAHTINEHIQTKPLKSGMEQLTDLVTKGFDILK